MEAHDLEAKVGELSAKVDAVALGYKIGALSLLILFSIVNLGDAFSIAKFQQIYREALPGKPVPLLTEGILQFQALLICLVFIWPILGTAATFTIKRFPMLAIVLTALLSLVALQIVLTWLGLFLPMFDLSTDMSDQH